jgi:hypothetical protein
MNDWEIAALILLCYVNGVYLGWLWWGRGR